MMKVIKLKVEHDLGETVYLKTDPERLDRIVTGFNLFPDGFSYRLSCGTEETPHYEFEITKDKNFL